MGPELGFRGFIGSSPPYVDRIWLWVYYKMIPLYPIFYLLVGDYISYLCSGRREARALIFLLMARFEQF